ncbi:MAG: rhamnulokinase family protein [Fimbriimonas sp.]
MHGAVAVDFGASSGRYAAGRLVHGRIEFEVIRQVPHAAHERDGKLYWDIDLLLGLCREAADYGASHFQSSTLGIDAWGVDHGFIDDAGTLIDAPVCYRDLSHLRAFESLAPHRRQLYEFTGIQHQPFNTICQLIARLEEDGSLPSRARWMILPDLLGFLLTGEENHEVTQASTTQLLGLDGRWSAEAFAFAGWPVPALEPRLPGMLGGSISDSVRLAHVGSHDTASAVCGFGALADDQLFLNVGTWSLVGALLEEPIVSIEAEQSGFTNERAVDGRVRFLKNIPGFYVVNRIHEELGVASSVPEWLASAQPVDQRIDLLHPDFFNPASMVDTCAALAGRRPASDEKWAGLTLSSLTHTIGQTPRELSRLTGRQFKSIRVGGGGSQSDPFCESLARESGLTVLAGPAEATVLGNLAMQFLASGQFDDVREMEEAVGRSTAIREFRP